MSGPSSVTRKDAESLAEKLDAMAPSLTPSERTLLSRVIANAAIAAGPHPPGQPVPGFSSPLAGHLALGGGLTENKDIGDAALGAVTGGALRAKDVTFFGAKK